MAGIFSRLVGGEDDPVKRQAMTIALSSPGGLWAKLGAYRAAIEAAPMIEQRQRILREAYDPGKAEQAAFDVTGRNQLDMALDVAKQLKPSMGLLPTRGAPTIARPADAPSLVLESSRNIAQPGMDADFLPQVERRVTQAARGPSFDFDTAQTRLIGLGDYATAEALMKVRETQRKAAASGELDWTGTLRDAVDEAGNPVLLGMTNRGPEVVRGFRPAGGGEAPRRSTREDEYGRKVTEEFRNGKWEVISVGPMPERAQTPQTVIYDAQGAAYFVDPRNPGAAPKPILTGEGKPIAKPTAAPKPATEGERTAAGYLSRMEAAEGRLAGLNPLGTRGDRLAASFAPGSDSITKNWLMSEDGQKYQQAAMDWIRAKLRKESGAAIGNDEAEQEYRTYFPMPGDGPEKIKQKAIARKEAMKAMQFSAGAAYQPNTGASGAVTVRTPDGRVIRFPNKQAADNFKLKAGIR